jgi:hypothetical protein
MRQLRSFTLDGQIQSGGAWVAPRRIRAIIRRVLGSIGKFEHASLQINFGTIDVGREVDAADRQGGESRRQRRRGGAGARRWVE